jgi:hypothetical protein
MLRVFPISSWRVKSSSSSGRGSSRRQQLLHLWTHLDHGGDHDQCAAGRFPPGDAILDRLDDLGYLQKQVQIVGNEHRILEATEIVDCLYGVPGFIDYLLVRMLPDASLAIPYEKSPSFTGKKCFCPVGLLGEAAECGVACFEIVCKHRCASF